MYWTVHLTGGPQRVNHAAVIVGDKVYSFGGYCSRENYHVQRPIDVHILNTGKIVNIIIPCKLPLYPELIRKFVQLYSCIYGSMVLGVCVLLYLSPL
jgi:hypothetical protein